MTRLLLLLIAVAALLAPTAEAAAKRTCRSGDTVYKKQGVRVFMVVHIYDRGYSADDEYYACGPRSRRPVHLYGVQHGYGGLSVFGRSGDKVLFETGASGEGGGDYATVGWFDARTSEARKGELAGSVSNDVFDVVVAKDGSLGVVVASEDEDDEGQQVDVRVGYLARAPRRGALRGELVLATAGERYVKRSLAFAGGDDTLAWKLASGQARSAPVIGEKVTCTAGTTLAESDGARVFEVLPRRKTERGFQADVLAACARGATKPRELAVSDVYSQSHWVLRSLKRAGSRVAFLVGDTGVGLLDGGQVRFVRPKDIEWVEDVAVGTAGPAVFAGHPQKGGGGGQELIARLTAETADTFRGWERLATQGGTIVAGTLAVGDDARVAWRTTTGLAQSTPLAGETTLDCTTGSTIHDRDGLRVFELLLAGADDARLLACPPGAPAPVQLLSATRNSSWRIIELARESGRIAIHVGSASAGAGDRVITFDAEPASVRAGAPNASSAYGEVRDVAVAPDGRITIAIHSLRKWKVVAFALGGPGALTAERTIAKPGDGVQAGSLTFSADGTRVVWRNRAGAERSAALS